MSQRMFGLETEYSFSPLDSRGRRVDRSHGTVALIHVAHKMFPSLPDQGSTQGLYLGNGSRLYIDTGAHPELATPEVVTPTDLCRYALAGDGILRRIADQLVNQDPTISKIVLTRSNVSFGGDCTTWGSHESYRHHANLEQLSEQIIPHLISRIIYTGAGGFNNRAAGLEFMVSPRVAHLMRVVSSCSTSGRGIYHTKDESLSGNGHRLHVLSGESLCSQTGTYLRFAITALVVLMIEAGLNPCSQIRVSQPLAAMRRFAADPDCTATVRTINRQVVRAIDMQRHIQQQIEAHLGRMPDWAPEACVLLGDVLNQLEENGLAGVARKLDWATKLALYREFLAQRGLEWKEFLAAAYNPGVNQERLEKSATSRTIQDVCHQLLELNARFSQLGDDGPFNSLDRAGALDHHVPGVDNIQQAMAQPPLAGRAHLRGECVKRFHGTPRLVCSWTRIIDESRQRYLDLSDPFETVEKWKPLTRHSFAFHERLLNELESALLNQS